MASWFRSSSTQRREERPSYLTPAATPQRERGTETPYDLGKLAFSIESALESSSWFPFSLFARPSAQQTPSYTTESSHPRPFHSININDDLEEIRPILPTPPPSRRTVLQIAPPRGLEDSFTSPRRRLFDEAALSPLASSSPHSVSDRSTATQRTIHLKTKDTGFTQDSISQANGKKLSGRSSMPGEFSTCMVPPVASASVPSASRIILRSVSVPVKTKVKSEGGYTQKNIFQVNAPREYMSPSSPAPEVGFGASASPSAASSRKKGKSRLSDGFISVKEEKKPISIPAAAHTSSARTSRSSSYIKKELPAKIDVEALARSINSRSSVSTHLGQQFDAPTPLKPESVYSSVGPLLTDRSSASFKTGETLTNYQAIDLERLILRETGEMVCGNVVNDVGYLAHYEMGLGKTALGLGLISSNPAPHDFDGARATLVLVPNQSLISSWHTEIKKFCPELAVCLYNSRKVTLKPMWDIVLATYPQVMNQYKLHQAGDDAPLFKHLWWRVIADEIHGCRNPDTITARGLMALCKRHALCLSGTPVQNTLFDFYIIFAFLGVKYEGVNDSLMFQRKIYNRKQKGPLKSIRAADILDNILEFFVITRRRVDPVTQKVLIVLPPKEEKRVLVTLYDDERDVYDRIRKKSGVHIFAKYIRIRQAGLHIGLLFNTLEVESAHKVDDCDDISQENVGPKIDLYSTKDKKPLFTKDELPSHLYYLFEEKYISSKLRAMQRVIDGRPAGEKTIVFTNFSSFIPFAGHALDMINVDYTEFHGSMSEREQHAALHKINTDSRCSVIIVSVRAGGTGLNIQCCNSAIIMDPWWNPYVEDQAVHRIHRMGQNKPVTIYHLIAVDTIDERLVQVQEEKRKTMEPLYGQVIPPELETMASWLS